MFSKVFIVCALAFCLAEAHYDIKGGEEKFEKQQPFFALEKSIVKHHGYPHGYEGEYQKQTEEYQPEYQHQYPYHYSQYFYQHPFLSKYFQNNYDQTSYVHPLSHEAYYQQGYPYHVGHQDIQGQYQGYPYHVGNQGVQGQYQGYPYHVGYQGIQGSYYPYNYQGVQGQYYPGYYNYHQSNQGFYHPFLNRIFGFGYHHYPQYEV